MQVLWVDALCINQKDIKERAAQVRLMGLIYFKARHVRIWLGTDDDPHEAYHPRHAAALIQKGALIYRRKLVPDMPEDYNQLEWGSLYHLLQRSWFKRVWVVQELGLSRSANFHCGETYFTREQLYDFLYFLDGKVGYIYGSNLNLRLPRLGHLYYNATLDGGRIELGQDPQEAETFFDILNKSRGLECTDLRDSIYAFLGHPSAFKRHKLDVEPYMWYPRNYYQKRAAIVAPNYDNSNSFFDVCTQVAVNAIKERGIGLQVLFHVAHAKDSMEWEVPSWAPLWNITTQPSHFDGCEIHYTASGTLPSTVISVHQPVGNMRASVLSLRAMRLAIIKYVDEDRAQNSVTTLVETLFPDRIRRSTYLEIHPLDWPDALPNRGSWADWSAFALTLTAGLTTTHGEFDPVPAEEHLERHVHGLESYLRRYEGPPLVQTSEDDDIANNFAWDIDRAGSKRCLYVTSDGQFGLGPMVTRPGDQVWLPLGATMPFIFRPVREIVYKLVGQTYLHGTMKGEAVEGKTERDFRTVILS